MNDPFVRAPDPPKQESVVAPRALRLASIGIALVLAATVGLAGAAWISLASSGPIFGLALFVGVPTIVVGAVLMLGPGPEGSIAAKLAAPAFLLMPVAPCVAIFFVAHTVAAATGPPPNDHLSLFLWVGGVAVVAVPVLLLASVAARVADLHRT